MQSSVPSKPSLGKQAIAGVAVLGVVVLVALIVRELMPQHRPVAASSTPAEVRATAAQEQATAPARPVVGAAPVAQAPAAPATTTAAAPQAQAPAAPAAATIFAAVAADPESFSPESAFHPPVAKTESYSFESLPGFGAADLKRTRANPTEWVLGVSRASKLTELAPAGGMHEAATVKDAKGNEVGTWFVIDAGPLAPAFATMQGPTTRVMSRAYVQANQAEFPPEVTALLEK